MFLVQRMQTGRDEEDEAQDDQCKEEDPQAIHGGGHQCHTAAEGGKTESETFSHTPYIASSDVIMMHHVSFVSMYRGDTV